MAPVRPPLRDRIVLFLNKFTGFEDEVEVPVGLTQKGMAKDLGVKRAQVAQLLLELKDKDYVEEKVRHVKDSPRRLKTYDLTGQGKGYAEKLKRMVLGRKVEYTDEEGNVREMTVKDILEYYSGWIDLDGLLRVVDEKGRCDHERISLLLGSMKEEEKVVEGTPAETPKTEGTEIQVSDTRIESYDDWTKGWLGQTSTSQQVEQTAEQQWTPEQYQLYYQQYYQQYYSQYPGYQVPAKKAKPMRILYVAGFICLLASAIFMMLGMYTYESFCCAGGLFLFIIGIVLVVAYYITLRQAKIEKLEKRDRRLITGTALILAYIMAFFASMAFNDGWTEEEWRLLFAINIPLIFALLAYFLIPMDVRGQIGLVVGTFLFSMAVGAWISLEIFKWLTLHPVIWMATGAMALMVGTEIARPSVKEKALAISTGLGLYMVFASIVLMHHVLTGEVSDSVTQAPPGIVAGILSLWTALGVIVLFVRFTPEANHEVLFQGMTVTAVVCIGVGFILFGAWFLRLSRFEGAVDFMVGLPVIYYGLIRLKGVKANRLKIILMIMFYSIILEILTLGLMLGFF